MSALMFVRCKIHDPEKFMEYAKVTPGIVEQYGGKYIVMQGETEPLEGDWDDWLFVMSEWPSMDAARAFWNSPEYSEAKKLREGVAEAEVVLLEKTA